MNALRKGWHSLGRSRSLSDELAGFVLGYAIVVLVMAMFRPRQVLLFKLPTHPALVALAPFIGIACIALEYVTGVVLLFLRTKKFVTRATIHAAYSAVPRVAVVDILAILAFVVGEEVILRQFLFKLLANDFGLMLWSVILTCTVVYALNHLAFGTASAVTKLPSGLLYTSVYYLSGLSILVVILAHATQNLTLLAWSRRARAVATGTRR